MPSLRCRFLVLALVSLSARSLYAFGNMLNREPEVPTGMNFVRSLDVDTYVERINRYGLGAQSGRVRVRFRDPDNNAFVGMVVGVHHFNQDLRLGDPLNPRYGRRNGQLGRRLWPGF